MTEGTAMTRLLLVIPAVAYEGGEGARLDKDFANNLSAYLANFDAVTVLCPALPERAAVPGSVTNLADMDGADRAMVTLLPEPYREDRYLRHRARVSALIGAEIDRATHLLISPHSAFDWSTLAALIAIDKRRAYDMEADWNLQNVSWAQWREMRPGPNKLRKYLWIKLHTHAYLKCMRGSSVALLQGGDVFEAYKDIAPNARKVLNVQITEADVIDDAALQAKIAPVAAGQPLDIVFAGRAIDMKGPREWLAVLERVYDRGVAFRARWFGAGDMLDELRGLTSRSRAGGAITFEGAVSRAQVMDATRGAAMFLFCHKTAESPRNLVEALASGAPLVGFGSAYSRDLVSRHGGGAFTGMGDVDALAGLVADLHDDRSRLAAMIGQARASAMTFDRDAAIHERIGLIKTYAEGNARQRW